ncbi:hypothetical protein, partial [Shinella sp. SUS2]|uniref:hypothetical protein n=1 Tax=Shinella sp. SUS2 TaxID=1692241 RepID=UPI001AEBD8ED
RYRSNIDAGTTGLSPFLAFKSKDRWPAIPEGVPRPRYIKAVGWPLSQSGIASAEGTQEKTVNQSSSGVRVLF